MTRLLPNRVALYAFILTLTGGLTACHQAVTPTEEELVGSCEQAVRITARVSPFGGAPAGTRADVTGTVDNEQIGPWQPKTKNTAQKGEVRLSRLYVLVTKRGSDEVVKTLYYYAGNYGTDGYYAPDDKYKPEVVEGGKIKGSEIPARKLNNPSSGEVSMDMTLLPGDYTFLLVANSRAATYVVNTTKQLKVSDLNQLFDDGNSFVAVKEYDGNSHYDFNFPMLGYGDLTVPATPETGKPVELTPEIPLERQMARIDVTLTTATDASRKNYLTVDKEGTMFDPSKYRLTQFLVLECTHAIRNVKEYYPYTLFPVKGAYTALPYGLPRYPLEYTPPKILDDDGIFSFMRKKSSAVQNLVYSDTQSDNPYWERDINDGDGGLRTLWSQSLIYMMTDREPMSTDSGGGASYMYLPAVYFPGKKDPDKEDMVVRLQLKFTKLDGSETLTYRIPIHNESGAKDYYSIRRNTIYDIDLTFYGNKLEVKQSNAKYTVDTWEDQEVDIPW